MRKSNIFLIIAIVLGSSFIHPSMEFNVGASSYYIWRGFDLNSAKEMLILPYVNLALGDSGLSFEGRGFYNLDQKELREVDVTVQWAFKPTRRLLVKLGYTEYRFFNLPDPYLKSNTREGYVSVGLPWTPLGPAVTAYYDFGAGDGLYLKFELHQAIPLLKSIRLELSSHIGYNAGQWLPAGAKTGFSDFNFTAMLPIKVGRVYLIPFTSYTAVLLDSISSEKYFWYGVTFGY